MNKLKKILNEKSNKMKKEDWIIAIILCLIFGVLAFYKLGSNKNPQTFYNFKENDTLLFELNDNTYLELSVRSSCPLKYWLILANGVGIIDADYYNNPDNEGHIYFQLINLSPFDIEIAKGDIIGQGVLRNYLITDDDKAEGIRQGGFGSTGH